MSSVQLDEKVHHGLSPTKDLIAGNMPPKESQDHSWRKLKACMKTGTKNIYIYIMHLAYWISNRKINPNKYLDNWSSKKKRT
jgi:hypothetical protein